LIPNHYHLLVKQKKENGISKFMHKLGLGYTAYINSKYNRTGALFSGTFKSVQIKTESHWLKISCYINGNPEIHKIAKADEWIWSSYLDYIGKRNGRLCDKDIVLRDFKNIEEYIDLTEAVIKDSRDAKGELKKYYLE